MIFSDYKGEKISRLGYGLMRLPQTDKGEIDRDTAGRLIDIAINGGVNYFDTAYVYHDGESEEFAGECLANYPRQSFNLATKLPGWALMKQEATEQIFMHQLEKCRVDYFDFYLLHSVSEGNIGKYEQYDSYGTLCRFKEQGLIKNLGFSFHGPDELFDRMLREYDWDFVQLQINYYDWERQNAKGKYEKLALKGIPCVVMEPVRGGSLHTLNPAARDVLAQAGGGSPASYALRWTAGLDNAMCLLSGMSDERQLVDNLATFNSPDPLSDNEMQAVNTAGELFSRDFAVPCTGCRYCVSHCANAVAIPEVFAAYNKYCESRNSGDLYSALASIQGAGAGSCLACGACTPNCPQGIDIPARLAEIARL